MNRNCKFSENTLKNLKSYVDFHPSMLPDGISKNRILNYFEFLSPRILILHGSAVTKKKFSIKKESDLDIVCVSIKAAFWPLEQLYKRVKENNRKRKVKIDVSIITYKELLSIIKGDSSLSTSFQHGFSILYYEGKG